MPSANEPVLTLLRCKMINMHWETCTSSRLCNCCIHYVIQIHRARFFAMGCALMFSGSAPLLLYRQRMKRSAKLKPCNIVFSPLSCQSTGMPCLGSTITSLTL